MTLQINSLTQAASAVAAFIIYSTILVTYHCISIPSQNFQVLNLQLLVFGSFVLLLAFSIDPEAPGLNSISMRLTRGPIFGKIREMQRQYDTTDLP